MTGEVLFSNAGIASTITANAHFALVIDLGEARLDTINEKLIFKTVKDYDHFAKQFQSMYPPITEVCIKHKDGNSTVETFKQLKKRFFK